MAPFTRTPAGFPLLTGLFAAGLVFGAYDGSGVTRSMGTVKWLTMT